MCVSRPPLRRVVGCILFGTLFLKIPGSAVCWAKLSEWQFSSQLSELSQLGVSSRPASIGVPDYSVLVPIVGYWNQKFIFMIKVRSKLNSNIIFISCLILHCEISTSSTQSYTDYISYFISVIIFFFMYPSIVANDDSLRILTKS